MLEERRGVGDARVREHDVEAAKFPDHAVHEGLDLRRVAHVQTDRDCLAAAVADLLRDLLGRLELDVAEGHRRALLGKQERRRAPDAERAAGDRRHPTLQAHRRGPSAPRWADPAPPGIAATSVEPAAAGRARAALPWKAGAPDPRIDTAATPR